MKIHYLNCGVMHPRIAFWLAPHLDRSPCICLLLEDGEQLVLVDSGFGTMDMRDLSRLGTGNLILNTQRDESLTAVRQVEDMGFKPEDVRHIICTHLDRDHAGGLSDFPHAMVHVSRAEMEAALNPRDARERERYRPCHFAHGPKWVTYDTSCGEGWLGMENVLRLEGISEDILLVPLPGHTRGHCGVAVNTGEGWLLHAGDSYYVMEELRQTGRAPIGVQGFRLIAHCDHRLAMRQIERLKRLLKENEGRVRTIASHDQFEYRNLFGRPLE